MSLYHNVLITCAKKIKLKGINQAALDLFMVKTKQEFAYLIPLQYLDQPPAISAFIKHIIRIDQNFFE